MIGSRPLAALLLVAGLACEPAPRPCPAGTVAHAERARSLVAAVRGSRVGPAIAGASPTICFGGHARGTSRPDGVVVLADSLADAAATARLAHQWMHVVDGLHRFPAPDVPCDRQLVAALAAEARAIVAEIEVCDELACDAAPFTFAAEVRAAAPAERAGLVLARLQAEPEADGLAVLVRDYRARCPGGG
ncbi:hypothetical protein OV079_50660 [Nannocystis pusilla]|uniref:Lipoprotein n=1 Tax=Nannocystis pusilla TaxID=889268 RepID=A0A9X3J3D8_9BACT|nr:hypothetical protein [Nannocystis pusilla]MCY1013661.1 hypothetical protein [Nannocystis pusilla]